MTGTNAYGNSSATSNQTAVVAAAPPVNTVLPTISGTATGRSDADGDQRHVDRHGADHVHVPVASLQLVGRELREHRRRDVVAPTRSSAADVGSTIRVVVTGTNAAGNSSATSTQTAVVAAAPPVNTVLPTISGTRDGRSDADARRPAPGPAPRRSPTPTSGVAATRRARAARTSPARRLDLRARRAPTSVRRSASSSRARTRPATRRRPRARPRVIAAAPPVNTVLPTISGTRAGRLRR